MITMNESYKELMVKRERGIKETVMRIVCIVPTVLLALLAFTGSPVIFIAAVACGDLDKEITVDKVMARTRRKRVAVLDVNKIEIMAPHDSDQLAFYKNRQVKTTDLSAGHDLDGQKLYLVYYEGSQCFLLNLDEDFTKTVKAIAPRKVFTE